MGAQINKKNPTDIEKCRAFLKQKVSSIIDKFLKDKREGILYAFQEEKILLNEFHEFYCSEISKESSKDQDPSKDRKNDSNKNKDEKNNLNNGFAYDNETKPHQETLHNDQNLQHLSFDEQMRIIKERSKKVIHQLDIEIKNRSSDSPVGIKNTGNSCYISCIIQILFYNKRFLKRILKFREKPENSSEKKSDLVVNEKEISEKNRLLKQKEEKIGVNLIKSFQKIFGLMMKGTHVAVDPTEFFEAFIDPYTGKNYITGQQKDVVEFMGFMFNLLEAGLKRDTQV